VVGGVEMAVESAGRGEAHGAPTIAVHLYGPLSISRNGIALTLPASRKVRGLFAYLLLSPHPVSRGRLCELLWEVPNDPRGELRWCLSKMRGLVDEPGRPRISTPADRVGLDMSDCFVDATTIATVAADPAVPGQKRLSALVASIAGNFLEGMEIDRSPAFNSWITAQRRRFHGYHVALLEQLVQTATDERALGYLEKWAALAPFDQRVHGLLLGMLARRGHIREGEEHAETTAQLFESEGLDSAPIRQAWRTAKAQGEAQPRARPTVSQVAAATDQDRGDSAAPTSRRGSIAIMPFVDRSAVPGGPRGTADALARDVITRLAKLRSLFVIAQGTMFALHDQGHSAEAAGRMLNVDYVVSGAVQRDGNRLAVTVELVETQTARLVWAETFDQQFSDAFAVLDEIGNRIVASVASEIETSERNRAVLKSPNSLDAWEAHHRGLWHMYRFNKPDNDRARHFFEMAVQLDPTFARAYAGLSFTYFQSAFQGWERRDSQIEQALEIAGKSLMADERDPTAHWAMGRALWMRGQHNQSIIELERTIDLSPNFALGHYMLALVHSQTGDPSIAIASSDRARDLSPFDPMLFGPLGARAMALVRLERFEEAADWGVKAAARPNAHAHIHAIAALSLALAGRSDQAREHLAAAYRIAPRYCIADFLTAMQFASDGEKLFRGAAKRIGMK
jgi:DNA-binding SARP family transcriptional activator